MNDQASNLGYALRTGVLCAVLTALVESLVIYFAPAEWTPWIGHVVSASIVVFWIAFITRLTGSDLVGEIGVNYPDLTPETSIHDELAQLRSAIISLDQKIASAITGA